MTNTIHRAVIYFELFDDYEREIKIEAIAKFYEPEYYRGELETDGEWHILDVYSDGVKTEIEQIAPKLLSWNGREEQRMTSDELTYKILYRLNNPIELPF
jgi:hypothetical protein